MSCSQIINNVFLLNKDPMKVQNTKRITTNASVESKPISYSATGRYKLPSTQRRILEQSSLKNNPLVKEVYKKRLSVNNRGLGSVWPQNNRKNTFTNSIAGRMFEDTSMDKEYIRKKAIQQVRVKMGKPTLLIK